MQTKEQKVFNEGVNEKFQNRIFIFIFIIELFG
jgi:hypothetical protein